MAAVTGNHGAATEHTEEPQLAASGSNERCAVVATVCVCDRPTDVATEHAQQPPPAPALQLLLRTKDIQQLRAAERARVPQRSLHKLARDALNAIASAGPNNSMDRNLEPWFPWRPYVACHKHAHAVIGAGITLAKAEFMDSTKDT